MQAVVRAPEINRPNVQWLNCDAPISLADLQGKFVILDFWTYCCINCQHVLPILKRIEETFPEEVVVIGVHSPKFTGEKDLNKLQSAIERHDIQHPVIQDVDMSIWQEYAIRAWPTLVFISPDGHIIGECPGEPDQNELLRAINATLEQFKELGTLYPDALDFGPALSLVKEETTFKFPTKITPVIYQEKRHYAIADHGHHQIVLLDEDGTEVKRFGSGTPDLQDGTANDACFQNPNGMVFSVDENCLYVADTGNHALRRIDFTTFVTTTVAGTGKRGGLLSEDGAIGTESDLASPWDVDLQQDWVLFTNAGTHQIGSLAPDGKVRLFAGTGQEGLLDGKSDSSHFAQPSSLIVSKEGGLIFIIDAETSALRAINIATRDVKTLIGTGLFDFGDKNGILKSARLQHPLAVSFHKGNHLLIADSYNDKIKRVNLVDGSIVHFSKDFQCSNTLCTGFNEPSGIFSDGENIFVCDTNNHRILKWDSAIDMWIDWAF